MKKLKLLVTALLITLAASSQAGQLQQIKIVSFTVKSQLPGIIDNWVSTPAALILVAQKVPGPVPMKEPRLVVQIKSGGALVCGNTPATARPVDPFDVRTFNTAELTGSLFNCHELKEGTYTICVQFFNTDKVAISQEVCKDFKVEEAIVEYSPPTLITPDNGKKFTEKELQGVVMFRWTPLVPKPKETVTYRLRLWQLMQGQNGVQAMKSNTPIATKDVENLTQATVTGIWNGPCKPPYLCDFIWNVQALNHAGKPMGNNNGTSEPYTFSVGNEKSKGPDNVIPEDKAVIPLAAAKEQIRFRWTPVSPRPTEPVKYQLTVWQLMQGQTASQAMKSNKPFRKLDVDGNGTVDALTDGLMANFLTGPCKPPYLCDFVWNVQATTRDGNVIGTSEPTVFKIANNDIDIQIDSLYVSCCNSNGTQNVYIKIKNNLSNTVKITQLNIDKVNGVSNVISIIGLAPALPVNITGNGFQAFTGTIKCIDTAKTLRFFVRAEDALDNAITETEVETDTLGCPCDPCRYMSIKVEKDSLSLPKNGNPTLINLVGSFSNLDPNQVKKITAEIIYFNITQTKDTNCAKCVFDSKNYGNFYPPGSALPGYTGPVFNKPDYSRLVTWNSTIIKDCGGLPHDNGGGVDNGGGNNNGLIDKTGPVRLDNTPARLTGNRANQAGVIPDNNNPVPLPLLPNFNLPIAVPEMNSLSCCGDAIKICIRYTYYDFCCHACEVIKCYEIKREK